MGVSLPLNTLEVTSVFGVTYSHTKSVVEVPKGKPENVMFVIDPVHIDVGSKPVTLGKAYTNWLTIVLVPKHPP
jgi:hypothetical protein